MLETQFWILDVVCHFIMKFLRKTVALFAYHSRYIHFTKYFSTLLYFYLNSYFFFFLCDKKFNFTLCINFNLKFYWIRIIFISIIRFQSDKLFWKFHLSEWCKICLLYTNTHILQLNWDNNQPKKKKKKRTIHFDERIWKSWWYS